MKPDVMYRLIPCSMYNTCMYYVLYDEYPRDKKKVKIDITVCLKGGKVVELCQRECVSSIVLPDVCKFKDIQSIRNFNGTLFYIVAADNDVILLQSTDQMSVYRRISNVVCYEVCDPQCSGDTQLIIKYRSHTEYIPFNDSKNASLEEKDLTDSKPVISALKIKLTEAEYHLVSHENAYKQIEKLRQRASYFCHGDELQLETSQPVITFCNKKIIIDIQVRNDYDESINDVCVFVHNTSSNSISYTSIVYKNLLDVPFYTNIEDREIKSKHNASVVAVIPVSEFKSSISSRIDFSVILSYERQNKNYLKSFEHMHISAADVMGNKFDVLCDPEIDKYSLCIAMLSTTIKTSLCIKQKGWDDRILLAKILCGHFKMDLMGERIKIAVHKYSPLHILHGIMVIFEYDGIVNFTQDEINYKIDVYTRSPSQVMAFIHLLYDTVPFDLVVTTPSIQISPHEKDSRNNLVDYTQCAVSLLNQASITLEYLDSCLVEMSKTNNASKVSMQIDLLARGSEKFEEYRSIMVKEAKKTFEHFLKSKAQANDVEEIMEIESGEI